MINGRRKASGEILEHLIFELVAVDHQQHCRLVGGLFPEQFFCSLDHGEGLAAALGMPDQAAGAFRVQAAPDGRLHRPGLVLAQDVFVQLLVLLGKDDVVLQEGQHLAWGMAQKLLILDSSWPTSSCFQLKMFRRTRLQVAP